MYILRIYTTLNKTTDVVIQPMDQTVVQYINKYGSPDSDIAKFTMHMGLYEYRDRAQKELNLELGGYTISETLRLKVYFLYAWTLKEAEIWKEWVESQMLVSNLIKQV